MAGGLGVEDLTGNGLLDIVISRVGEAPVVALNQGDFDFTVVELPHPNPEFFYGAGITIAQLDGHGGPDIAVSSLGTASAAVWHNRETTFVFAGELVSPNAPECSANMTLVGAHANDDEHLDLVITEWAGALADPEGTEVWLGNGRGGFDLRPQPVEESVWGANDRAVMALALVDVDRDLRADFFFSADWNDTGIQFGGPEGGRLVDRPFTDTNGMGLAVTDMDRDAALEFYVSSIGSTPDHKCTTGIAEMKGPCWGSRMYEISPAGEVTDVTDNYGVSDTGWAWGTVFADLDADGADELVASNGMNVPGVVDPPTGEGLLADPTGIWVVDPTTGEQSAIDGTELLAGKSVVAADLDRDGDLDLVHAATVAGVHLFENHRNPDEGNWVGFTLRGWASRTDSLAVWITRGDQQLTPIRILQRGGWFQTHQPADVYFGLGEELRQAMYQQQATLVIEEIGGNGRRCTTGFEPGRWHTFSVAGLSSC